MSQLPSPARCAGDGCTAGGDIWPLFHARHRGVYCRLCSSCLLLSYRSLYCCCCFLLLGSSPPPEQNNGDPLIAPPAPTTTCRVCNEAVAHLSCLQYSASGVFVCPACSAATTGRAFSYATSCLAPLDVRGARVFLLATRMSLALLRKDAAAMQAEGERLAAEAANERKEAYRLLGLAHGIDPKLPSTKEDIPPPESMGLECSQASMGIALDLNEPAQPPSPAMLTIEQEEVPTETAMAYADLPPPRSLAAEATVIEGVCRAPPPSPVTLVIEQDVVCMETAMAYADPPPRSLAEPTSAMEGVRRVPPLSQPTLAIRQEVSTDHAMSRAEPPPLSLSTLTIGGERFCSETTMASAEPPLLSLVSPHPTRQEGVSTELTMASAEPPLLSLATPATSMSAAWKGKAIATTESPPRHKMHLFWYDTDDEDEDDE